MAIEPPPTAEPRWKRFVRQATGVAALTVAQAEQAFAQDPLPQTPPAGDVAAVAEVPEPPSIAHVDLPVKARIVLIGGGISGKFIENTMHEMSLAVPEQVPEETYDPKGMYREMVRRFKLAGNDPITVITSASKQFNEIGGRDFKTMLGLFGVKNVHVIDTHDPKKVDTPENLAALEKSKFVFVDGGDQKWLKGIFHDTKAEEILRRRCREDKDFTYAGTSAGAMIPSLRMPFKQNADSPDVTEKGFGVLPFPVDTHFHRSGRLERLGKMLRDDPENSVAIGLGEGTAVEIYQGEVRLFSAEKSPQPVTYKVTILNKRKGGDGDVSITASEYECKDGVCILRARPRPMPLDPQTKGQSIP